MSQAFKYRAFISYSHADEKWAAWLHSALETYRLPKALVGQETEFGPVPEKVAPVFRDRDELASATDLGTVLTQALSDSACQIVICSPNAARSHWVNEEILTYKRLGRSNRVFSLIVGGEPYAGDNDEAFPKALRFKLGADGQLSSEPAEPIAADARPGKDGKQNAKLKIIAGMLGVGLDSLKQREQQRRQRRLVALAAAAVVGMTITSTLAVTAWFARIEAEAQRARAEAETEIARQTKDFMVGIFEISDPSESLGNSVTARDLLDKGAARIEDELQDQPAIQTTLMDTMGTVYTSLGLYTEAAELLEGALSRRRTLYGMEHTDVADSLNHLGEVLTLKADYDAAESYLREALDSRRRLLGEPHALVANTLADLAEVLTLRGEYDAATPLISDALAMRRELHGDAQHAEIAESVEDLAANRFYLGDYAGAVDSMREAHAMRRAVHGEIHPKLAEAIGNLAFLLYETGDAVAAKTLYEDALAMLLKLYGPDHKDVAVTRINVAHILHDQGDYDAAGGLYREALRVQQLLLGDSHPDTVVSRNDLAWLYYDQGEIAYAIDLMRETLGLARSIDPNHPGTGSSAISLASWLTEVGEYEEAASLVDEALEIRVRAFGESHPEVGGALRVKADLLLAVNDFAAARDAAHRAGKMLADEFSDDHWRVAAAASAEGAALAGLGEYDEAESLLLQSNEIFMAGGALTRALLARNGNRLDALYAILKN